MDVSKAKSAIDAASKSIAAAQTAVQDAFSAAAKGGSTEGIVQLVKANQLLKKSGELVGKATEKVDEAKDKATPKAKEAPAAKK